MQRTPPVLMVRGNISSDFKFDHDSIATLAESLAATPLQIPKPIIKVQSITTRVVQEAGNQSKTTKQSIEAELYAKAYIAAVDYEPVAQILLDFLKANKLGGIVIIGGYTYI